MPCGAGRVSLFSRPFTIPIVQFSLSVANVSIHQTFLVCAMGRKKYVYFSPKLVKCFSFKQKDNQRGEKHVAAENLCLYNSEVFVCFLRGPPASPKVKVVRRLLI